MNAVYQDYLKFRMYYADGATFQPHIHTHCEIVYVVNGEVSANVNGDEYLAKTDDALFIMPHQIHSFKSGCRNGLKFCILMITPELIGGYTKKIAKNELVKSIVHLTDDEAKIIRSIFEFLFKTYAGEREPDIKKVLDERVCDKSVVAKNLVLSYVTLLLEKAEWKKKSASSCDNARRVLEYCMEHYCEDISLTKVAEALSINPHTVTRIFSSVFKCNFRSYINEMRMSAVTDLLLTTEMGVTEIAFKCGFDTLRTFNRIFLARYGVSPSEFRRANKTK